MPKVTRRTFTPKELIKLLFYKKVCPQCDGQLKKKYYDVSLEKDKLKISGLTYHDADLYQRTYYFHCGDCNLDVKISDLKKRPLRVEMEQ
ncbi:hypothetical protein SAMN02799624_06161 [Paenibacillus sp. UNC496MF]|uniref:hypothetical protein n=1 Tax=Paenibacillus sp. UNC496MF TaxID=1502753 RepID=UPI0008EF5B1A|nr:hypothetical protein [Paenibacillus sp. UNC496MF]SFJ82917.1 hypothetical protein SAMN02799624_06161 [Paenibacillus sp. UNC496MF]